MRIIFRFPFPLPLALINNIRRIEHHAGWCKAVVQRGKVHEGFECGAGLAFRLGSPVELAESKIVSAGKRQDTPRMGVQCDQRAACIRNLPERKSGLRVFARGDRFNIYDVADG